jgi:hypothetical protein
MEAYRLFIGVVLITNELRKNAISLQSQVAFDEGLCASIQALSKGTVGLRAMPHSRAGTKKYRLVRSWLKHGTRKGNGIMAINNLFARLALGALAGLAGTLALQALRTADKKIMPGSSPPMKKDPGEFMVKKAEQMLPRSKRRHISRKFEAASAKCLSIAYGMTFGALYAGARPKTKRILLEGTILGLVTWATGYLGWLPRLGIMPPVWKHKAKQVALPVAEHALYGVATVAGYRWVKEKASVLSKG